MNSFNEEYYYGQGKLFISTHDSTTNWRFIGDVSALSLNLKFDERVSKRSVRGRIVTSQRFLTAIDGDLGLVLHNFDPNNLAIALGGQLSRHRQSWTQEHFHSVKRGDVVFLAHQNIRGVDVGGIDSTACVIDVQAGMIEFLKDADAVSIEYDYTENYAVSLFDTKEQDYSLRYIGINLAESNKTQMIELYKTRFNAVSEFDIINKGSSIGELNLSAALMPDLKRQRDSYLDVFGRVVISNTDYELIRYNDEITHDFEHDFAY